MRHYLSKSADFLLQGLLCQNDRGGGILKPGESSFSYERSCRNDRF
jgi:hypothetical protein